MSEIRHRDRILEAIDQLRKRKARPDVNRICSFMFRRFSVNCVETKLDLQKLIDAEIVIKVDYKGNTSYRNAAKWAMLPAYRYKKEIDTSSLISSAVAELIVLEPDYLDIGVPEFELEAHMVKQDSRRFSKKNLEAIMKREVEIGTLIKLENGNYFLGENSASSTMDRPSASNVGTTAKQQTIKPILVSRQASRQRKIKILSKYNDNSNDSDKMKPDEHSNTSESANVGFRVGGRQKRARVVFDPSDNNLPTRVNKKRGPGRPIGSLNKSPAATSATPTVSTTTPPSAPTTSPPTNKPAFFTPTKTSSVTGSFPPAPKPFNKTFDVTSQPVNPALCFKCHSYGQRIKGVPEKVIPCSYCTNRVHPSCLEVGEDVPNRDGAWQCSQCKRCSICDEAGTLVVCVVCRDAYHYQCHTPHVTERARAKQLTWHCSKCTPIPEPPTKDLHVKDGFSAKEPALLTSVKKEAVTPPKSPEPKLRDVPANCLQDPFKDIPIDETIPDAKHWTTNQVYQYLSTHLKPELAQVFKDQDIDGQSLLLMKRLDVLTGLSLKVGPALKVYKQVRILQTRKNHPTIFWV